MTKDVSTSFGEVPDFFSATLKLSTESWATRLSKYSLPQELKFLMKFVKATVSEETLEEKPNCTKIQYWLINTQSKIFIREWAASCQNWLNEINKIECTRNEQGKWWNVVKWKPLRQEPTNLTSQFIFLSVCLSLFLTRSST